MHSSLNAHETCLHLPWNLDLELCTSSNIQTQLELISLFVHMQAPPSSSVLFEQGSPDQPYTNRTRIGWQAACPTCSSTPHSQTRCSSKQVRSRPRSSTLHIQTCSSSKQAHSRPRSSKTLSLPLPLMCSKSAASLVVNASIFILSSYLYSRLRLAWYETDTKPCLKLQHLNFTGDCEANAAFPLRVATMRGGLSHSHNTL